MKRKPTLIILSLVAAFSLLAVTAFASAPDYAGYEAFKTLASNHEDKDMESTKNATLEGSVTVKDNGVTLVDFDASLKADGPNESFSGTFVIEADDISKEVDVFAQDDLVYVFDEDNDEFYKVDKSDEDLDEDKEGAKYHEGRSGDREISPAQEELLDFVMGDLKDEFELVNNSDGSQTIKFELSKDEMPMILNLMFSAMDSDKASYHGETHEMDADLLAKYPLLQDLKDIKVDLPEITDNMELDYLKFAITTDANDEFQAVEFNFIVTGDDESGLSHTQEIEGSFTASQVGTTSADVPNLEGKEIIDVDHDDFQNEEMNARRGSKGRR